jgi:hypothetical protein
VKLLFTPLSILGGLAAGHGMRHGYARLTGSWPGEEKPDKE